MVREVRAYACEYKCGKKTDMIRARIEEHELTCFKNPDRRACITCVFNDVEHDDWAYRNCKGAYDHLLERDARGEFGDSPGGTIDALSGKPRPTNNCLWVVFNCPGWQPSPTPKEADGD